MAESSRIKTDMYGNSYVETRDSSGRVVQIVKRTTDFWGDDRYETYDANMRYIGYSVKKTDFYGDSYLATYDRSGQLIRTCYEKTDFYGDPYLEIRDAKGQVIGSARNKEDFYGDSYVETEYRKTNEPPSYSPSYSSSDSGSSGAAGEGGGIGVVFGLIFFFGLALLFTTLHNPEGREKIHRFVVPLVSTVPIAIIAIKMIRLKDPIDSELKTKMLASSCGIFLILQGYYIFYTSRSMAWMEDSLTIYLLLWAIGFLPYYAFCLFAGKTAVKAYQSTDSSSVKKLFDATYVVASICYWLDMCLMMLRWEFYAGDGKYGRTIIEILTIIAVGALSYGGMYIGTKLASMASDGKIDAV